MKVIAKMWGNSLAVRIPKSVIEESKISVNQPVDVKAQGQNIIITPMKNEFEYSLDELLSGITEDNLHDEIDFDGPVGKELL